jgi:hypothetical protein
MLAMIYALMGCERHYNFSLSCLSIFKIYFFYGVSLGKRETASNFFK